MWGFPGASRPLRGAPGASRTFQEPPGGTEKCALPGTAKASNLERGCNFMRDGQAGLGHPPWRGGVGPGVWPGLRRVCKGAQRRFSKGSERPEAGCLGE